MNIESTRFGTLTAEPGKIIDFPLGLAGFESSKQFSLFHPENDDTSGNPRYFILQSVNDPDAVFHLTDPARFGFNYEIALSDDEARLLKLNDPQDIAVTVMVWRAPGDSPDTPPRANLKAPILINTRERRGLQHIFQSLNCTLSNL